MYFSCNPIFSPYILDVLLIGICNSLTSLYAGLVVFGVVGFISVQTGTDIDKVNHLFINYIRKMCKKNHHLVTENI